ncbi:hypothetical protein E2986_10966 [Frieseomelitta varia]|uniref:Uncharacterized protein n=1 Tax=Frieseomelitta varia TaxID=561572 RepID=A0A833RTG3_9HYME|nr:hypothetical protein E2986_10966 [Frieseomelitta varia]
MVISAISLGVASYWLQWSAELQFARKHAMMRDYIMRHPEHFPEPGIITVDENKVCRYLETMVSNPLKD